MTAFDKIIGYDSIKNKLIKICDMLKNKELFDICAITGLVLGEKAFEEKEDGEWFTFELNGDTIIVNENDEVQINGKWITVGELRKNL